MIKPLVQDLSGDPYLALEGVKAYAFNADTTFYVASYADALEGIASLKDNPRNSSSPSLRLSPTNAEGAAGWVQMPMSNSTQMVLAVDTELNKIYAYTQQELAENLPVLYVALPFKPWKEAFHKDGNWSYYNEFYTPPTYLDCFIEPAVQTEEGGAGRDFEPEGLRFRSRYHGVVCRLVRRCRGGQITSKDDDSFTRSNPNFTAYKEDNSTLYKMVSTPTLMVVVVDRVNRLSMPIRKGVDLEGASPTFPVLFRPWIQQWIDDEEPNGWIVVNPELDPDKDSNYANTSTPPMNTPRHTLYLLRLVVALLFVSAS